MAYEDSSRQIYNFTLKVSCHQMHVYGVGFNWHELKAVNKLQWKCPYSQWHLPGVVHPFPTKCCTVSFCFLSPRGFYCKSKAAFKSWLNSLIKVATAEFSQSPMVLLSPYYSHILAAAKPWSCCYGMFLRETTVTGVRATLLPSSLYTLVAQWTK